MSAKVPNTAVVSDTKRAELMNHSSSGNPHQPGFLRRKEAIIWTSKGKLLDAG